MNKQLDIFDVEPEIVKFDISKAHVKQHKGKVSFTDVLAKIPRDAKDVDELPKKAMKKTGPDYRFDMFVDYVTALWRYQRSKVKNFSWEAAEELCKKMRDQGKAVKLRVYFDSGFKPVTVDKYLR
ncbi:cell division protein SepF [Bacillus wiedmannii]|uniref:cell division protein SepF n=1 Tax=Bacillus wiedmannii TaxID=1890302 RepID=UPI0024ACC722|nr:cell division protein SepF [Bacillus wiedmannii]MDI6677046.1 cell division protein SepF [Bacillus wiedmannii]